MLNDKQKSVLHIFDVVELLLTICSFIIFTILVIVVSDSMKYCFLGGLLLVCFHLYNMIDSMKKNNNKKVVRHINKEDKSYLITNSSI